MKTLLRMPAQMSEDRVADIFQEWRSGGESLKRRSSTPTNHGRGVEIFVRKKQRKGIGTDAGTHIAEYRMRHLSAGYPYVGLR